MVTARRKLPNPIISEAPYSNVSYPENRLGRIWTVHLFALPPATPAKSTNFIDFLCWIPDVSWPPIALAVSANLRINRPSDWLRTWKMYSLWNFDSWWILGHAAINPYRFLTSFIYHAAVSTFLDTPPIGLTSNLVGGLVEKFPHISRQTTHRIDIQFSRNIRYEPSKWDKFNGYITKIC